LEDLLARETFFRDLPAIEQHAAALATEYDNRHQQALDQRSEAYRLALQRLEETSGWDELDEDQQSRIAAPIRRCMAKDGVRLPIAQLRSDCDACEARLKAAIAEVRRIVEGERLVTVTLGSYFGGGIETEEQLESALTGIREECAKLIGAGKKVIAQ
jgi:hypothetical protein